MEGQPLWPLLSSASPSGAINAVSRSKIRNLINQASKDIPVGELDPSIAGSYNRMPVQSTSASFPMQWILRPCQFLHLLHEEPEGQIRRADAFSYPLIPIPVVTPTTKKILDVTLL